VNAEDKRRMKQAKKTVEEDWFKFLQNAKISQQLL